MLKGKLTDFDIISIFEMLNQQTKSGILTLNSLKHGKTSIYFFNGNIIDLSYENKEYTLGMFLVKRQIIPIKLLKKLNAKAKKEMKLITSILVEMGYITEDLEALLLEVYYDDAFRNILSIKEGQFAFKPDNHGANEFPRIFYIEQILLEYVRQRDELKIIKNNIPIENAKISRLNILQNDLTKEEFSLYEVLDLEEDIDCLKDKILMNYFDYINTLLGLQKKGKITITKYMNEEERERLLLKYDSFEEKNFFIEKFDNLMLASSITLFIIFSLLFGFKVQTFFNKDIVKEIKVKKQFDQHFYDNYSKINNANK